MIRSEPVSDAKMGLGRTESAHRQASGPEVSSADTTGAQYIYINEW